MRLPGTAHGTRIELAYLPSRAPAQTSAPLPEAKPQPAPIASPALPPTTVGRPAPSSPNTSSPSSAQPDSSLGSDALGDGDINIALASFFPRPSPDLSSLAHGTAGDVILDIIIDSSGRIANITLTRGLGPGIDDTVIATVQQWTFHPATRNGEPIASEQELHFHYERRG